MQELMNNEASNTKTDGISYRLWELRNAVDRYLLERGVGHFCHVTVNLRAGWFELKGTIDSQWTRAILFSLVPEDRDGERFIIDRLKMAVAPNAPAVLS